MTQRFSASSAGKLIACPASANLDLAIPNWVAPVVDHAAGAKGEGTRVHEMLEPLWTLSPSDLRHALRIIEYVSDLRSKRRFNVLIEETVQATWLKVPTSTTADLVLFVQDEIHVIDFKWGKIEVPVHDNAQLKFYDLCYAPLAPKAKGVWNHIVQPRANNVDAEFVSADDLKVFMDEAIAAEAAIANGSLTFGPSHHCTFCPANPHGRGDKGKPYCPAMMQLLYPSVVDTDAILNL